MIRFHRFRAFSASKSLLLLGLLPGMFSCGPPGQSTIADENVGQVEEALTCPTTISPLRSIEIVHPNIMDDARASVPAIGPWSLAALIRKAAPSASQADSDHFLRNIFESWLTDQTVSGEGLPARTTVDGVILNQFVVPGSNPRSFDLTKLPFELIAVANRVDLRSATDAGELRFVFGLTNPPAARQRFGRFQGMTLIAEYKMPFLPGLENAGKWAAKWHELDAIDPATNAAAFSAKLQEITDAVTARNAAPGSPNGSALLRIRTNEFQLAFPWELREFNFAAGGFMAPASTKSSPNHETINNSPALLDFINQNPLLGSTSDTLFQALSMPATFNGGAFLGGKAQENFDLTRWSLPGETQSTSVRVDNFGLLTCNGCHNDNKGPTDIAFYQVAPQSSTTNPFTGDNDGTGRLSQFMLTGEPAKGARRPAELTRRAADFQKLLCAPAGTPDLVVVAATAAPGNVLPGQPAVFSALVQNRGTGPTAQGTIVGVAFKVDGNLVSWSDTDVQSLSPGSSVLLTANSGPSGSNAWNATSGGHSLLAWVDDVNRVAESNESNNQLSVPLGVGPDLVVTSTSFTPFDAQPGTPVTFSATVRNNGTQATPAGTIVGVGFKVDGVLKSWSDTNTTSLAPGASVTLTANNGPAGSTWLATAGGHSLEAWADDVNRIFESNDTNNKRTTPLSIGADLTVISTGLSPDAPVAGNSVSFFAQVKNVGTTATPSGTIVGVSFNVDGTQVSWSDNNSSSLAPGQTTTLFVNNGPGGNMFWNATSGTHTIQAWVDDVNRINDVNRNNNKQQATVIVQ